MTDNHKESAEEYNHNEDLATVLMIRNTKDLDKALHYFRESMQSFAKQEVEKACKATKLPSDSVLNSIADLYLVTPRTLKECYIEAFRFGREYKI